MFLGLLFVVHAFAGVPEGGAGALATTGDPLGDTIVAGVEVHPEFERYALRLPDGRVALAEMTTGAGGLCDVGALTIFPRADLSGVNDTTGMDALCERLAARKPTLRTRREGRTTEAGGGSPGLVEVQSPMRWTPIHLALGLLALLALPLLRLDRMLVGVTAASLLARLWAAPRGVTNGALAGYEKLVLARGSVVDPPYGQGWGAIMGLAPGWPDSVFLVDLGFAVLAAPLLAAIVRREAGTWAGLSAGLLFALLPTHIGVSATETMHVAPLTFGLLSVLAAGSFARGGGARVGVVAALAAGIAVNVRPDALPFVVVPVLLAASGVVSRGPADDRTLLQRVMPLALPALALAWLVGTRLRSLGGSPGGLTELPGLEVLLPRFGEPVAAKAFQLFWHTGFSPPVAAGLALVGIGVLLRGRRLALLGLLLLWVVVTTIPFTTKVFPLVDAVRLQLAGQAPWIALAGIGVAALPRWALPMALLTFLPYLPVRPWVQTQEWQFLRETVPDIPADMRVQYDGRAQRAEAFAAVMQTIGPARWSDQPAPEGGLRYVGLDCRAAGGCDTSGCVEWRITRLDGRIDLDLTLEGDMIGFWRCPGEQAPAGTISTAP
ncbi:MAG: hypothetical protein V4850_13010 [Myxococcota bacterium]